MKSSLLAIGEVAEHFNLPTHVLRHWESVGLLSPSRAEGGRRRYTRADLVRVGTIVEMKRAGLGLPDIADFLGSIHTTARKDVLRRNQLALQDRIAALQSALALVEAALHCSHDDIATCPTYQSCVAEMVGTHTAGAPETAGS
ncbi:MerR family transcriptional regulator [Amycolatopsis rhabdoformis]|uniref:MerR family transcriptional regulator n=1 Tax=Amycolatopsis rhabdoformis TaxID=1448059 RepID=A0ABZ1HUY7_9PSEU|nr:MerR family transcriptional regulator [Amycolatopsis rhabdoformis]WSE26161.1 MerR family transcriptional regulator [Amycolatopsis rhabdoformis]